MQITQLNRANTQIYAIYWHSLPVQLTIRTDALRSLSTPVQRWNPSPNKLTRHYYAPHQLQNVACRNGKSSQDERP